MLINCNRCNKKFSVFPTEIQRGRKYCSPECYFERNGQKRKVICKSCKKEFFSIPSKTRKYCSRECYRNIQISKPAWNSNPILRECLVCKKEFRTILAKIKAGGGKYCSKECYLIAHSKNTETRTCKRCRKQFQVPFHRLKERKYCSNECRITNITKKVERVCLYCKKQFSVKLHKVKDGRGKFCSRRCLGDWMSENLVGEKANGWKGGITNLYRKIRQLGKYSVWKKAIKIRDKKCVLCESEKNLEADHFPKSFFEIIIQYNIKTTKDAIKCKELWDTEKGRTLCVNCHRETENYGNKIYNKLNKKIIQK